MSEFLLDHAIKNAWCSPEQDRQVILKPARISAPRGTHRVSPHMWGDVTLPTVGDQYHLYQVGQIHPSILGLFQEVGVWHTLSYIMGIENLVADVYTNDGIHLPRFETWALVSREKNLLLAIRDQPRIAALKTEPVYLRLYSNSYFSSDRADLTFDKIECIGARISDATQALNFQRGYHDSRLRVGLTTLYVNGLYVDDFLPSSLAVGDIVEYVYDSTVKMVKDFSIAAMDTFDSILDAKRKYLLHYEGDQIDGVSIDYRDDIDLYLIRKTTVNSVESWRGVYYHKNQNDALRMITHRDYAISVTYVNGYLLTRPEWLDVQELTVRMVVRKAGWRRPLIDEHHRIKELYKLNEGDRLAAMLGTESSVAVWHAAALENSYYPKIMDALNGQITDEMIQSGYGYNAVSKLLADSPLFVEVVNGRRQVSLPYGLQVNSTIYEYDVDGNLLGYYYHTLGAEYTPSNEAAVLIEGIVGRGSFKLSMFFNQRIVPVDPSVNTRFYTTSINSLGVVDNSGWVEVTGDDSKYMLVNGNAVWLTDPATTSTVVKSDRDFLAYQFDLSPINGLLKFSITAAAFYPQPLIDVLHIPVGTLDLWLNGKALIEELDYIVRWPEVVIINKTHLLPGDLQKIVVRGTGFSNADLTRDPPKEVSFIKYGLLSRNARFNIRDDKVVRIVANGRTFHREQLSFSEDVNAIAIAGVPNGAPYLIENVVVPLRELVGEDTYSFRTKSLEVDQAVEDYLTLKLPEEIKTTPDLIPDLYAVYSPFASTVMHDMLNGILSIEPFKAQYSDKDVEDYLSGYTHLLAFDPTSRTIDVEHVSIHPHNLLVETVLDIYQYNFLNRAIKVFLNNRVDITRFISIKPGWI